MTEMGWEIDEDDDIWDDDPYDDDPYPGHHEPDYGCWTCRDNGEILGLHRDRREVNCPSCRPTPRQVRREPLRRAWWARKHNREIEARVAAGMPRWEAEAPF